MGSNNGGCISAAKIIKKIQANPCRLLLDYNLPLFGDNHDLINAIIT